MPSSTRVFKDLDFLPKMEEAKFPHKFGAAWTAASDAKVYNMDFGGVSADCHVDIRFSETRAGWCWPELHLSRGPQQVRPDAAAARQPVWRQGVRRHRRQRGGFQRSELRRREVQDGQERNEHHLPDRGGRLGPQDSCRQPVEVAHSGQRISTSTPSTPGSTGTTAAAWRRTSRRRATSFSSTSCRSPTPGSGRFRSAKPSPASAWSRRRRTFAKSKESREKFFWECIKSRPELYEGLKAQGSQQMKPFKDEGDYSYAMKQLAGDRVVLVG